MKKIIITILATTLTLAALIGLSGCEFKIGEPLELK